MDGDEVMNKSWLENVRQKPKEHVRRSTLSTQLGPGSHRSSMSENPLVWFHVCAWAHHSFLCIGLLANDASVSITFNIKQIGAVETFVMDFTGAIVSDQI